MQISIQKQVNFLVDMLNIPSPTGYHCEIMPFIRQTFEALNLEELSIAENYKGALLLSWTGTHHDQPRGVTAHADTLGLMVREVKANGALKVNPLGGIVLPGAEFENVTIRTFDDQRYRGTLIPVNPSSHVNAEIVTQPRNADTMEIRIDAKTTSSAETRALGIEVGDFIFVDPRVEVIDTGFIRARFLDNKAGVANIWGAMLALKEEGAIPLQDTHFLIANYEEVGHGGSNGFPEGLHEVLAIDMGALGMGQNGDEFHASICTKDSSGPYHFDMVTKLRNIAIQHNIPHKTDIYPYYSSDGSAYWRAGGGARVGLIGPGVASSHSYERTHIEALEASTRLLAQYLVT